MDDNKKTFISISEDTSSYIRDFQSDSKHLNPVNRTNGNLAGFLIRGVRSFKLKINMPIHVNMCDGGVNKV